MNQFAPETNQTFCLAGPSGKPHVVSQMWLETGEERGWKLPPLNRPLRLRSPQVKGSVILSIRRNSPKRHLPLFERTPQGSKSIINPKKHREVSREFKINSFSRAR
jgi:hypothetical protein